jgi:hypothetical protein
MFIVLEFLPVVTSWNVNIATAPYIAPVSLRYCPRFVDEL